MFCPISRRYIFFLLNVQLHDFMRSCEKTLLRAHGPRDCGIIPMRFSWSSVAMLLSVAHICIRLVIINVGYITTAGSYLDLVQNYRHRKAINSIRTSSHTLARECGRHHNIPLNMKFCHTCYMVEDEQSGRSPKVVALFSATNFSSYIIELFQLHDTNQIKCNHAWIHYNIAIRSHLMI